MAGLLLLSLLSGHAVRRLNALNIPLYPITSFAGFEILAAMRLKHFATL